MFSFSIIIDISHHNINDIYIWKLQLNIMEAICAEVDYLFIVDLCPLGATGKVPTWKAFKSFEAMLINNLRSQTYDPLGWYGGAPVLLLTRSF